MDRLGLVAKNPEHKGRTTLRGPSFFESKVDEEDSESEEQENENFSFEESVEDVEAEDESIPSQLNILPSIPSDDALRKYSFKLKHNEAGNILTVHHTVTEDGQLLRIQIAACCFNDQSNKLVVIDKRGSIFVFDFVSKRYWRLSIRMPKARLIRPSPLHRNDYIVGNKLGQIYTIDVDNSIVSTCSEVGTGAIDELSWSSNDVQDTRKWTTLMRFGSEAVLVNLKTLRVSHQLEFDESRYTLKFAGFLPNSDQFFTCFTNDSLHVWSSHSLGTLRSAQPIRARDRRLRLLPAGKSMPEITLRGPNDSDVEDELAFECRDHDFADGLLLSYCFTPDGNKLCLSALDGYLLMLSTASFDLEKMYRLTDFILKKMAFLPQPKERILFGITARNQAVMLDLAHTDQKLIVQRSKAASLSLSRDGKLLSVISKCGEVNVWSTCRLFNALQAQTNCLIKLKSSFKQLTPLPTCTVSGCMNQEVRHLLKPDRLKAMLKEYGCYPEKYRFLIWTSLLELPCNGSQFQSLIKLGTPANVRNHGRNLKIRNDSQRRGVIKVWACLSQWCKVIAYADFMPHLIYPFVKQLPKNGLVSFEVVLTLILNHFHLWFEFHPLPPSNYLAMCENLLQRSDDKLCKYYKSLGVSSKDYAWSLLSNAFAEVLEEQQWLILWDNIVTEPPFFPIFLVVAYNLVQREVLLRLPDHRTIVEFFHDQNPVDICQLISKARKLAAKCDATLHPKRFIPRFTPIPKGVYPKFLNYPSEWIEQQEEQSDKIQKSQQDIDARIRNLELEEVRMMERLENGLKQEEHTRRVKEMEELYAHTIQREEERLVCQRKLLVTYQMEVRRRKSEVITKLQESEQRRKVIEMEKDIDQLMHTIERERRRHNQEMQLAEDEIHNQEMDLLAQRYYNECEGAPLAHKYYDKIQKLCQERDHLQKNLRRMTMEKAQPTDSSQLMQSPLLAIESSIAEIVRELSDIISTDRSGT
ncbi:TBC1 domain family member 31 [Drosophila obscura]|uniref:TBC1 domain family member 31 n=1 Tax=Drosophila obscura TaxID=7282 RepID=UPI001BB2655B|nr:TBC1 domain family member 31 [Drosophila obscura]